MDSGALARLFGRGGAKPKPLPRATVEHDSVDKMMFGNYADDSPRFRAATIEDAPRIAPDVQEPPMPDFTTATREEVAQYQAEAKAAREASAKAPPYGNWEDLSRDLFYSYHHVREPGILPPDQVDPGVAFHGRIMQKITAEDDHARSRNVTRDDATMAAMATQAGLNVLKGALQEELVEQARQAEEFEKAKREAEQKMDELQSMRNDAAQQKSDQGQVDPALVQQIKDAVIEKRQLQQAAVDQASQIPAKFDQAAHEVVVAAAAAGAQAMDDAGNIPSFGQGFGEGEPIYESPEQALSIAEQWSKGDLKKIAELYGRIWSDFHFKRSKRVVGGQDEIVDITIGDDLKRLVSSELPFLADDELFDDFLARYVAKELLVYSTVGEEHAGRGPVVLVVDGSSSMSGERTIWARAVALTLLNVCRREKRDFAFVEFSSATQVYSMVFPHRSELKADDIVEMASHFFRGGTAPLTGVQRGLEIMEESEFKKADLVLVSDGEAKVGDEDKRVRDRLKERGVRIHGIGIGSSFGYLKQMCDPDTITTIHDMDLEDPNAATGQLAVQVT